MDYALILRALEKHCRMAQQAVTFAREYQKGGLYADALSTLEDGGYETETILNDWGDSWRTLLTI
jgi:hypothetical protein